MFDESTLRFDFHYVPSSPPHDLSHGFILVFVFDESSLRSDFTASPISPPHQSTSPSCCFVLVFDEYISPISYWFWCSMNLHCVSISTTFRFHRLTISPISPPHQSTSPSCYFVLVFDEYISPISYWFWCSMNLHCVSIFTMFRVHRLTIYLMGLYLFSYSMNLHYVPISPPHHLSHGFIFVFVFDESPLRSDFIASPIYLTASPISQHNLISKSKNSNQHNKQENIPHPLLSF
ncbi:hypothetical protein M2306_000903 [Myroides gitamensis]|nr:hypothetical protein [Myroides odoratus]MDH6600209.1 hypothetical protein [Myroides gitamensis]